ncbi:hypothetical protein Hypma_013680 [Hypsizygus marmoreus]|uniref:Uncharacterized protein n=1 Tax=Hypsizygus marmoreus TaxID=39966 RepID=A0A369JBI3_HYPMA|nr:hypothetical protein Hypma_013680 [Hypsizygus marmoreus]
MSSTSEPPSYNYILSAASDLASMESLALRYQRFTSTSERLWYYNNRDAALKLVQDICSAGKRAEGGKSNTEVNDPYDPSFAYKTLRLFTRTAILSIRNAYARKEYLTTISTWAKGYSTFLDKGGNTAKLAAERAVAMRNFARTTMETKLSTSSKTLSAAFKKLLGEHGHSFAAILEHAKAKVHLKNVGFAKLSEEQLTSVYSKVVELSGVGNRFHNYISAVAGAVGYAIIALTIASLIFDIGKAALAGKDEILTKVLENAAELGGTLLGAYAAEAAAAALFGNAELLSLTGVALFGVAGSIVGGALGGAAIALIIFIAQRFGDKSENEWTAYLKEPILYRVKLPYCYVIDI